MKKACVILRQYWYMLWACTKAEAVTSFCISLSLGTRNRLALVWINYNAVCWIEFILSVALKTCSTMCVEFEKTVECWIYTDQKLCKTTINYFMQLVVEKIVTHFCIDILWFKQVIYTAFVLAQRLLNISCYNNIFPRARRKRIASIVVFIYCWFTRGLLIRRSKITWTGMNILY